MMKEIIDSYEKMKPGEDAKKRMLHNIYLMASQEDMAGKERNMKKLKTRHFLRIAATAAAIAAVPTDRKSVV